MKKVLSVFLTVVIILTAMLSLTQVVSAAGARYGQQMSLDSSNAKITYDDSFWDYFGENLIKDPTVAAENFDGSGVYKRYSKITADYQPAEINLNHWWDKYIDFNNGFYYYYQNLVSKGTVTLSGPDENGYYTIPNGNYGAQDQSYGGFAFTDRTARSLVNRGSVQNTGSLTNDGSGVIYVAGSGNDRRLPLPAMEADSYYVVKFKMKTNGSSCFQLFLDLAYSDANYYYGFTDQNSNTKVDTRNLGSASNADTVVFLIYTGDKAFSDPSIDVKNGNGGAYEYFDDFGMYKVTAEYAADQTDGVKLTDPRSYLYSGEYSVSNGANYNGDIIYNVGDIDLDSHSKLEANLITDPTVNAFEAGVYSESGWWSNVINGFHGVPGTGGDLDEGKYTYASPAYRGLVKSDTSLSHTNDGSGAIKFVSPDSNTPTNKVLLPIEALDSYSYYVLSFWIKSDNPSKTTLMFGRSTTVTDGICSSFGKLGTDWQRIIAIIYTGDKNPSKSYLRIDTVGTVTVLLDDFGLYKINDMEFGELCMNNNYLIRDGVRSGITAADLDANGMLNAFDIVYYRNYLLGYLTLNRTDMNGDNSADIRDLVKLKKNLAG